MRLPDRPPLALACSFLAGCERGCARTWFEAHGVGSEGRQPLPGAGALNAVDCPDGLARCNGGVVEVSRLARIAQPCRGTPEQCACPWERLRECEQGCVVEGVEVVAERGKAATQLCAPAADAGAIARPLAVTPPAGATRSSSTGARAAPSWRARNAVVGTCVHGCVAEGASVEDDVPVTREGAFAILCAR